MTNKRFQQVVKQQLGLCMDTLGLKSAEYATELDRLDNFTTGAALQRNTRKQTLAGYMAKHTVSIYTMIHDDREHPVAQWTEKITDHINYLLLLKALVIEEVEEQDENSQG